jgi:hypothetical protein
MSKSLLLLVSAVLAVWASPCEEHSSASRETVADESVVSVAPKEKNPVEKTIPQYIVQYPVYESNQKYSPRHLPAAFQHPSFNPEFYYAPKTAPAYAPFPYYSPQSSMQGAFYLDESLSDDDAMDQLNFYRQQQIASQRFLLPSFAAITSAVNQGLASLSSAASVQSVAANQSLSQFIELLKSQISSILTPSPVTISVGLPTINIPGILSETISGVVLIKPSTIGLSGTENIVIG